MGLLPILIFIVFLVLKLAGIGAVANWSWAWVTSPLWISFFIYVVYAALILISKICEDKEH